MKTSMFGIMVLCIAGAGMGLQAGWLPTLYGLVAGDEMQLSRAYVLGDSFAGDRAMQRELVRSLPDTEIRFDAVGGSTLAESLARLEKASLQPGEALVILDGGLTDAEPLPIIEAMVARLPGECPLWIYVEPVQRATPNNFEGSARWLDQARKVADIERRFPGRVVPMMAPLRALPAQSAEDEQDLAKGWIAGSYRRDRVHLNEQGAEVLARLVVEGLEAAARQPCAADWPFWR